MRGSIHPFLWSCCSSCFVLTCTAFAQPAFPPSPPPEPRTARLKKYDQNGDGKLSDAEREALRKAQFAEKLRGGRDGRMGFKMQFPPEIVKQHDKDGDGQLNEDETQAAIEGIRKQWEEISKKYDKNGNGRLDEEELEVLRADAEQGKVQGLPPGFGGGGPPGRGRARSRSDQRNEIARRADTDHDGKLNADELRAAREELTKLPRNEEPKP